MQVKVNRLFGSHIFFKQDSSVKMRSDEEHFVGDMNPTLSMRSKPSRSFMYEMIGTSALAEPLWSSSFKRLLRMYSDPGPTYLLTRDSSWDMAILRTIAKGNIDVSPSAAMKHRGNLGYLEEVSRRVDPLGMVFLHDRPIYTPLIDFIECLILSRWIPIRQVLGMTDTCWRCMAASYRLSRPCREQ